MPAAGRLYSHGYQAILFDMDGVVVDTERAVVAFWLRVAGRSGLELTEEDLRRFVYGRPASETLETLFSSMDDRERRQVLLEMEQYEENDTYREIPGAVDLLRSLHRSGIPMALVTSGSPEKVAVVERQLGIREMFAAHVTSRDVQRGKPDPECYRLGALRLGVSPRACVVFEDSVSGIEAGVAAGSRCVGIAAAGREAALRAAGASEIIRDLSDVTCEASETAERTKDGQILLVGSSGPIIVRLNSDSTTA